MLKVKYIFLHLVLFLFATSQVFAGVIRDSEIEEAIDLVAAPIVKAARLKQLKIYLVNDDTLNAFTAGGEVLYINSGMLTKFGDIDVLRGVIAHEIGHITGKHIARQSENIDNYSKVAMSSLAIGLVSAAAGNPALSAAIALGGAHVAERSVLAYSRSFESSADQTALRLLEQSGHSARGMIIFFEYMLQQHRGRSINPYEQTHPLESERLIALKNFHQRSKFQTSQNSKELTYKFSRSIAKLRAFTTNPQNMLSSNIALNNLELEDYTKAILYFRTSDLPKSLVHIDRLIKLKPQDAFYQELKGQILFEFGKPEALTYYTNASKLRPNDVLIKLGKAVVGMSIYQNQPSTKSKEQIKLLANDLKFVFNHDPDNIMPLYYLAIYYEKAGLRYESLLNSALIAFKLGELPRAKGLAREAIKGLKPQSPEWYKANDIILTE